MAFFGWTNSKFQTVHFLIGACHTAIDAHRIVMQQIMDKESAIESNSGGEGFYIDQARDELAFLIDCRKPVLAVFLAASTAPWAPLSRDTSPTCSARASSGGHSAASPITGCSCSTCAICAARA